MGGAPAAVHSSKIEVTMLTFVRKRAFASLISLVG
ncbi:MAG: ABC transporter permease, partial [Rhizobiaceae bacterium]